MYLILETINYYNYFSIPATSTVHQPSLPEVVDLLDAWKCGPIEQ